MGGFGADQAFGVLVGLAHSGGKGGRHDAHAFSLDQSLGDDLPGVEDQGLFRLPQAIGEHSAGPGVGHGVFDGGSVDLRDLIVEAGAALEVVGLLVVAFDEAFAQFFLHLLDAAFPQVVQDQVDLTLKGFQAGNGTVRRQGVQLRLQDRLHAGVGSGFDGGDIVAQGSLPLLELLPGQKADRLVVGQAVLAGVLRIEAVDLPSDRLRRGFVLPEHFPRQVRAAKVGFILACQGAFGPVVAVIRCHRLHRHSRGRPGCSGPCRRPGRRRTGLRRIPP